MSRPAESKLALQDGVEGFPFCATDLGKEGYTSRNRSCSRFVSLWIFSPLSWYYLPPSHEAATGMYSCYLHSYLSLHYFLTSCLCVSDSLKDSGEAANSILQALKCIPLHCMLMAPSNGKGSHYRKWQKSHSRRVKPVVTGILFCNGYENENPLVELPCNSV